MRTLVVVVVLAVAGCVAQPPGTGTETDQQALTATDASNPWGETELTVAIDNAANESRDFRPLVADALDFWSNNSTRWAGYDVEYELDPDAENPDVVVEFVTNIESCANVTNPAGCAPYVTSGVSRPITISVVGTYDDESTRLVLKHELGHTLGLNHSEPPQSIMAPTTQLHTLPRPNATERRLPWDDSNFTVYLVGSKASAEAREQIRYALEYYEAGAEGTVPANVSYAIVQNRSKADVLVQFTDTLHCQQSDVGSCGLVRGADPDGDGALERYDRLHVTLSGIDAETIGWHVGYWLGYGFGFDAESEWPVPFQNASDDERRSNWWKRG